MIMYNKLVRDRIPEIIMKNGEKANIAVLEDQEYYEHLLYKLKEETQEFLEDDDDIKEIADIMEVLDNILKVKGITWNEVKAIQDKKREKNGGFNERYLLISVDE